MSLEPPTFADVLKARLTIRPFLSPTPFVNYPALDELLGARVYVKREDTLPTSAFKVRGGINLVASLTPEERQRGIVCSSTGNNGQSLAYASRLFGARCIVGVPRHANPLKLAAMRALGAEIVEHGDVFDDARIYVEGLAAEHGMRNVHSANEPLLIAGVATAALEIFEAVPEIDYYFVPLGGGSSAAGACLVAKTLRPETQVIAVQSAQAQAGYQSWKQGRLVDAPMHTIAEGLATRSAYELPQRILRDRLDDFLLVDDADLERAVLTYVERCHCLAEHAGAAALAGAIQARERIAGKTVAVVHSGANITLSQLEHALGVSDPAKEES
jgi:threonine dehydratase